jgi:OOP family OmpA-OmpF porin
MNIKRFTATALTVVGLGAGSAALAQQQPQDVGFYLGGSLGYSAVDLDTGSLAAAGMTTRSSDDNDVGWKLFAGYQFHRNWAVEGTYYDLGRFDASGFVTASPATPASVSVKVKGWGLAAVGILPLQQNFSLFGKLGGFWSDSSASASVGGFRAAVDDSNSDWLGGIGVMYNFSRNLGVRAEAEFIGSDVQFYSIGLQFKF